MSIPVVIGEGNLLVRARQGRIDARSEDAGVHDEAALKTRGVAPTTDPRVQVGV
jgi:hypothetical protein